MKWQISVEGSLLMLLANDIIWVIPNIFSVHQYPSTEVSFSSFSLLHMWLQQRLSCLWEHLEQNILVLGSLGSVSAGKVSLNPPVLSVQPDGILSWDPACPGSVLTTSLHEFHSENIFKLSHLFSE